MAFYQSVGTPRFYVNVIEWLTASGYVPTLTHGGGDIISATDPIYKTLPVTPTPFDNFFRNLSGLTTWGEKAFVAWLGHNFGTTGASFAFNGSPDGVVNYTNGSTNVEYDGFSIAKTDTLNNHTAVQFNIEPVSNVGSIVIGSYYDMPHSPDLSLTMSREYSGIKTIETKSGASLSNDFGSKPAMWGNAGAWELLPHSQSQKISRSGRRIWDLSFSYLDDGDVWGANQTLSDTSSISAGVYAIPFSTWGGGDGSANTDDDWTGGAAAGESVFNYNLLTDDSFYSQVIHRTNGGQLPFIFQPDNSNNNPDNFAIAKLDMKSFQFKQVANGVYNMKLKIREVW